MSRAQISWKSQNEDGEKIEVYSEKVGDRWMFYRRPGRYDEWLPHTNPTLEDWLILLDNVQRRIQRKWFRPEEELRLIKKIQQTFPSEDLAEHGVTLPEEAKR